jgi:hypothetical protein
VTCGGRNELRLSQFIAYAAAMDAFDEIAAILVGSPEPGEGDARAAGLTPAQLAELAEGRRRQLAGRLRTATGPDGDPLLATLAGMRRQRLEAEQACRLLVAYGREFVRPRPYRLVDLADAAGMSISGVRTAYADDEVGQVAEAIGRRPGRPEPPAR